MNGVALIALQSGLLLADLLPWIFAGALFGALLKTVRTIPFRETLRGIRPIASIPLAALSGAASPLCTLGSVPLVAGMTRHGLTLPAGMAFLAASSMVTPQVFILTAGVLGFRLALLQAVGGIIAGTCVGACLSLLPGKGSSIVREQEAADDGVPASSKSFFRHFIGQLEFSLFWLVTGVILSQFFTSYFPLSFFEKLPRGSGFLPVFAGTILSAPLYSCGGAALPVLSAVRDQGIGDGFILAFLVCGPATRFRSAAALGRFLRPAGLILYFLFIFVFSIGYGSFAGRL